MHFKTRRQAVQITVGSIAMGLLAMPAARAQTAWPKDAFDAKAVKDAIDALYKGSNPSRSDAITILAPELAENGGVVPVTVQTTLPNLESVALFADANPRALVARMDFTPRSQAPLTVRMKLAQSQNLVAVVKAGGQYYMATRPIKVSIGGCGG